MNHQAFSATHASTLPHLQHTKHLLYFQTVAGLLSQLKHLSHTGFCLSVFLGDKQQLINWKQHSIAVSSLRMSRVGIVLLLTVLGLCHALNFCNMPQCNELPHLGCNNTLVSYSSLIFNLCFNFYLSRNSTRAACAIECQWTWIYTRTIWPRCTTSTVKKPPRGW